MKKKYFMAAMIGIACLVSTAQAAGVEFAVGGWRQALTGTFSYKALDSGDVIDVENDLAIDDETKPFGRIKIETPAFVPNIYLVGAGAEFEGTGSKSVALQFGDTTFNADTALTSKIQANQYDIALYYGLPFIRTATAGKLNVDVGLNVRIADLDAEITGTSGTSTITERESLVVPVPMLYLAVTFSPIDAIAFEAEGRGISVGGNKFYSLTGRLRFQLGGPLFVAGGYRFDKLELDDDSDEDLITDIELAGPFVELGMKF
jgi:outer membrane protein